MEKKNLFPYFTRKNMQSTNTEKFKKYLKQLSKEDTYQRPIGILLKMSQLIQVTLSSTAQIAILSRQQNYLPSNC